MPPRDDSIRTGAKRPPDQLPGGIASDITERKRTEMRIAAEHAVTRILADAASLDEAAPAVIRAICEPLEAASGALWLPTPDGQQLVCAVAVVFGRPAELEPFVRDSRGRRFVRGEGLPGRVWASGSPAWVAQLANAPNFPRASIAAAVGLQSGAVFPITAGDEFCGAMEFFTRHRMEPDDALLGMMGAIGSEIGQFVQHRRAEQQVQRLNRDLRRRLDELQTLLTVAPVGIAVAHDPACQNIDVNPVAAALLGMAPGANASKSNPEADPLPFRLLRHGTELPVSQLPMQRAAATGTAIRDFELDVVRADGQVVNLLEYASPLFDEHGTVRGCLGVFIDISERTRAGEALRESEARFRQLADALPQIVWSAHPDGSPEYFNRRWDDFVGRPAGTGAADWKHFLHPDDQQRAVAGWSASLASGEPFDMEYRIGDRAGSRYRWHLGRALAVRDAAGHIVRWLGTSTDIDDRKRAEEALQEADRRKDEFLAMLGHELRNPLVPIRNCLHILGVPQTSAEQIARARAMMERQLSHLSRLVDDLLDVARISRGKILLRQERLDLVGLVESAVDDHRSALESAGVLVRAELPAQPLWVNGDVTRLAQVVGNMLHNAGKFTDRGGTVTVSMAHDTTAAVITIGDTGIGMAPEMLAHIFEPFTQADRRMQGSRAGLGLGLALVKRLVELHGGTVEASSLGIGQGSWFTIRLPLAPALGAPLPRRPVVHAPGKARRILIIEDDVPSALSMALLLQLNGHTVTVAHDGNTGVQQAHEFQPDVVLCDIGLPDMDGYAVARTLRADPGLHHAGLIALSGYGQPEDQRRAVQAGFDAHLTKPADPDQLQALIVRLRAPPP